MQSYKTSQVGGRARQVEGIAKVKHLNFLQQEVKYKKIAEQISNKLLQSKIDNFLFIYIYIYIYTIKGERTRRWEAEAQLYSDNIT